MQEKHQQGRSHAAGANTGQRNGERDDEPENDFHQ
jgi:hypothetical protein